MSDRISYDNNDSNAGNQLIIAYVFWHKKRIVFNAIILLAGLIAVFLYFKRVRFTDIIGMGLWGVVANGLYCIGYSIESYFIITSKGQRSTRLLGQLLFWFLTIGYSILTYFVAVTYFTIVPN